MSSIKHILLHAWPAWGHNKPLAALAVVMTRDRPDIVVTLITTGIIYPKFVSELKSKLSTDEYDLLSPRINVIDVSGPEVNIFAPLSEFAPAYAALHRSEPITCRSSGNTVSGLPPPMVGIVDPFAPYAFESIRATSHNTVPVITWLAAPAGPLLGALGPASLGGLSDPALETKSGLREAKARLLQLQEEPTPDTFLPSSNFEAGFEKIEVPGFPPMYKHEWFPQPDVIPDDSLKELARIYVRDGDGVMTVSSSVYEELIMSCTKKWLAQIGKPSYALFPLSLPKPKHRVDEDKEVLGFLDSIQSKFGAKSLIYISFGTFFWPYEQEKLIILIETLIANQTPFIFSHASPLAQLSDDFLAKINNSGIALEMPWSPQETILQHEVTGWFITHGGWNGIQECFEHKIPLIFWPLGADQPANATHLTMIHKAAFELIEVRSGENGTKPLLRFEDTDYKPTFTVEAVKAEVVGLLEKIKGEEGRVVRSNFEKLSGKIMKCWDEGEESRNDLNEFYRKFVD